MALALDTSSSGSATLTGKRLGSLPQLSRMPATPSQTSTESWRTKPHPKEGDDVTDRCFPSFLFSLPLSIAHHTALSPHVDSLFSRIPLFCHFSSSSLQSFVLRPSLFLPFPFPLVLSYASVSRPLPSFLSQPCRALTLRVCGLVKVSSLSLHTHSTHLHCAYTDSRSLFSLRVCGLVKSIHCSVVFYFRARSASRDYRRVSHSGFGSTSQ